MVALQWEEGHNKINEMFVNDPRFPESTCKSKGRDRFYLQRVSAVLEFKELLCEKPKYSSEDSSVSVLYKERAEPISCHPSSPAADFSPEIGGFSLTSQNLSSGPCDEGKARRTRQVVGIGTSWCLSSGYAVLFAIPQL